MQALRRLSLALLGILLLAAPSSATWSIVVVNLKTREVAVATATCLANFNIRFGVPVIVVGEGAAAAQSLLDTFGTNRRLIYFSFRDTDETPAEILARLEETDELSHETRQYGIVNFTGDPVTFTGNQAGLARSGVTGRVGDYLYAIQGNVLTGDEVVFACEAAFRSATGDTGQRLMTAMHAARELGGDGRCSCNNSAPTSCGVPPKAGFEHTAYTAAIVVARIGDANGGCNPNRGCAKGDYHMRLNVVGDASDADAVLRLQERYDDWRRARIDVPDGLLSKAQAPSFVPADGVTETTVELLLRDIDGVQLSHDDTRVAVKALDGSTTQATIGDVENLGRGRYRFTLRAPARAGVESYLVTAEARGIQATLYPHLEVRYVESQGLVVGEEAVSAARGAELPFAVSRPRDPGAPYWILASYEPLERRLGSLAGALPLLPLEVSDEPPFHPAPPGILDGAGRGAASLTVPPALLTSFVGGRVRWQAAILGSDGPALSNAWITEIRR